MRTRAVPRVKICCMADLAEMWAAVDAGASAVGLVSAMPSGMGPILSDEAAAAIACRVPPGVDTFLLTSRQDVAGIIEQYEHVRPTTLQLVDYLGVRELRRLRIELPGVRLVQVVHVTGPEAVVQAQEVASAVDAVLLDSGNPLLEVKELGGTGRRHDWAISARIRDLLPVPVFLAGGLDPANVTEAVRVVRPYALDVCSGLRVGGRLDGGLMEAFFDAVRQPGGASKRDCVMHTW